MPSLPPPAAKSRMAMLERRVADLDAEHKRLRLLLAKTRAALKAVLDMGDGALPPTLPPPPRDLERHGNQGPKTRRPPGL